MENNAKILQFQEKIMLCFSQIRKAQTHHNLGKKARTNSTINPLNQTEPQVYPSRTSC
jgi:hypothetical protein